MIVEKAKANLLPNNIDTKIRNIENRKAIPVRTAEETCHSIASALEGKLKYHPRQCIPPNTMPTTGIQKARVIASPVVSEFRRAASEA